MSDDREERSRSGGFARDVLPALAWTALIFLLGSVPTPEFPDAPGIPTDKLGHALVFGVLQLLGARALRFARAGGSRRSNAWLAALFSTLVGGALELWQLALPHRSGELLDLAADAFGAVVAALVVGRSSNRALPARPPEAPAR